MTIRNARKIVAASIVDNWTNKTSLVRSVEADTRTHPLMRMYGSKDYTSFLNIYVILATPHTLFSSAVTMTLKLKGNFSVKTDR